MGTNNLVSQGKNGFAQLATFCPFGLLAGYRVDAQPLQKAVSPLCVKSLSLLCRCPIRHNHITRRQVKWHDPAQCSTRLSGIQESPALIDKIRPQMGVKLMLEGVWCLPNLYSEVKRFAPLL
jgi:hypothetical protein